MIVRVTSRGRVTIPKPVRDRLHIRGGTQLNFEIEGDRAFLRRAVEQPKNANRSKALRGSVQNDLSTDQIMALIRGKRRQPAR